MAAEKANFGLKTKIIGLLSFVLLMLLIVDIAWTYESQKRAAEAASSEPAASEASAPEAGAAS